MYAHILCIQINICYAIHVYMYILHMCVCIYIFLNPALKLVFV